MIRCIDVRKTYRQGDNEITALAGITLEIPKGAFAVIMGPSGSGKSTLLHLIGGLDRPSSGDLMVDGRLIGQMADDHVTLFRRKKIGFVFQFFNLLPTLTALENVTLPFVLDGRPKAEADRRAEALLQKVGLEERRHHLPEELSGGEIQRVAVARALAFEPPVLLADEPTGNLDSKNGQAILDAVASNQQRRRLHGSHGDPQPGGGELRRSDDFFARRRGGAARELMLRLLQSLSWRHVLRHRLRTALTFFGIALGVAVIIAIAMVNRSLTTSFQSTIEQIAGKAVLQVANGESGVAESLFPMIRDTVGVRDAAAAVEGFLPLADAPGRAFVRLRRRLAD